MGYRRPPPSKPPPPSKSYSVKSGERSALTQAGQSLRGARKLTAEEAAFYTETVLPVIQSAYAEMQGAGQAPFYKPFDAFMRDTEGQFAEEKKLIRSDPRAFIYPSLRTAFENDGAEGLRKVFSGMVQNYNEKQNGYLSSPQGIEDAKVLANGAKKLSKLEKPGPVKGLEALLLTGTFNHVEAQTKIMRECADAYKRLMTANGFRPLYESITPQDLSAFKGKTPQALMAHVPAQIAIPAANKKQRQPSHLDKA